MLWLIFVPYNEIMKQSDKQLVAKTWFVHQKMDQKTIAAKLEVSETTISKWVNDFGWKKLRGRLLAGKEELLNDSYEELEELNAVIRSRPKGQRYSSNAEADTKVKLTAAIRNLESDLGIADLVESGKRFNQFLQRKQLYNELGQFAELWNDFLHDELKGK